MNNQGFAIPVQERYFDDYQVGISDEFGSMTVVQEEVIDFGRRFDPQPFHTDPVAAEQSVFGGLIASGWHTAGLMMRLLVEHYISPTASLGSPGIDELRWLKPVRPGDVLSIRVTVLEANRSRSKPDRGIVRSQVEVLNQRREVVMSLKGINLLRCREA
jgi:acyl dehydratase